MDSGTNQAQAQIQTDTDKHTHTHRQDTSTQTISFIEISIEAGILLGGKNEACFVLGVAGIEPMPS